MKFNYCIAAYNEEKNIAKCLQSLNNQSIGFPTRTYICINGCTDKTTEVVNACKKTFKNLQIKVLKSKKGLSLAQNRILENITDDNALVFVDADVTLHKECVKNLLAELKRNRLVLIVGGIPKIKIQKSMNYQKKILTKILNIRALNPTTEVSRYNVELFKGYVKKFPQKNVSPEFEMKSKIYFHGRIYAVRSKKYFIMPNDANLTDDTYLANKIHLMYGPSTIRIRYDAVAHFDPYTSIKSHFKTYKRFHFDKHYLDKKYPEFLHIRKLEALKLDWPQIIKKHKKHILYYISFHLIRKMENLTFRLMPKKEIKYLWEYNKK